VKKSVIVFSFFPGNGEGVVDGYVDSVGGFDWWPDDERGHPGAKARFLDFAQHSLGSSSFTMVRVVLPSHLDPHGDEAAREAVTEWLGAHTEHLRELPEQPCDEIDEDTDEASAARRRAARAALTNALED